MDEEKKAKSEERRARSEERGARGEGILRVEDTEYRLLFTNRAIAEAESATGNGIVGILQGFQTGTTGIGDVAHLMAAGLEAARRDARAGGQPMTLDDAYRIMDQVGFAECTRTTMEAIAAVLTYRSDSSRGGGDGDGEAAEAPKA